LLDLTVLLRAQELDTFAEAFEHDQRTAAARLAQSGPQ
jgi:hypothetical protein